ncbi:hypothetical protein HMPREF1570_2468 [Klebsiella oxytoca KA-2]|nr:hypothetical protein HMPREF1570_2468 [Klebsiella oxytoca KA-2]
MAESLEVKINGRPLVAEQSKPSVADDLSGSDCSLKISACGIPAHA